ncbi:MAG: STAS domain-containing protein [Brevinematia bacterium]
MDTKLNVKVSFYKDEIAIIDISGELTVFTDEFDILYKEIVAYLKMGIYKFIFNMQNLKYIDSSGIGLLMRVASISARKNTKICVLCDQPNILKVLSISKVDVFFQHIRSIEEGISIFEGK